MVLDELVAYLVADLGLVAATNLFHSFMPPSPNVCVVLYNYDAIAPEVVVGGQVVNIEYPQIQVVVRGEPNDPVAPRTLAKSIMNSFVKIGEQDLSGVRYSGVMPKQSPFEMSRDENFRVYIACNYHVMKNPS